MTPYPRDKEPGKVTTFFMKWTIRFFENRWERKRKRDTRA